MEYGAIDLHLRRIHLFDLHLVTQYAGMSRRLRSAPVVLEHRKRVPAMQFFDHAGVRCARW